MSLQVRLEALKLALEYGGPAKALSRAAVYAQYIIEGTVAAVPAAPRPKKEKTEEKPAKIHLTD